MAVGTAAFAALTLAACTASGDAPAPTGTTGGETAPETGGLDPAVAAAAASADPSKPEVDVLRGALWQGPISGQWFLGAPTAEEYGITLESDWMTDATVGRAQLASGAIDLVPGSPYGAAQLTLGGSDTLIVAGNYLSSPGEEAIYALPESGIESAADLAGKTVAFTALTGIDQNRVKLAIAAAGGDPDSMKIVASTFADMPGQLQNGTIDAADVAAYGIPGVKKVGAVEVFDLSGGEFEGRPFNVWMATKAFYLAHPNAIAAFQCAMAAGGEIGHDPAGIEGYEKDVLGWSDAQIAGQIQPNFVTGPLDPASVQADWDDEVAANGSPEFDVTALVVPFPKNC
ncbi:MAG: ABC transporter substrate-binding protein [Microbacteriaceae bacterium]|nr:ABC transporter substrate-binding protein [Microbacteriaceae bacterium]